MFSTKPVPSVLMYSEVPGEGSPPEADIEQFARRIGLDLDREPHLRYLAVEGINEPLPNNWKPCYDQLKKSWYYYNRDNKQSQWEHPMDEVYRSKVVQTRQDIAMNRILDSTLPTRPLKNLPPLKKLGGSKPGSGISKLGPIGSSPNISGSSYPNPTKTPLGFNDTRTQSNSLGDLMKKQDTSENSLQNPSSRMVKKPLGGLTLTGEGANFLKGSDGPAKKQPGVTPNPKQDVNGIDETKQNSIKSILSSSVDQGRKGWGKDKNFEPWKMNPDNLTEDERKMLDDLSGSHQKPGVKFQLDENTELKFEMSTDDNVTKSDESESEEESSEEEVSESLPRQIKPRDSRPRPNQSQFNESQGDSYVEKVNKRNLGSGEKASSLNMSEAAAEAMKETMQKDLDAKLKEYQKELDTERREREEQIRQHMNMTVEELQEEKDTTVKRVKTDLEEQKNFELDKVKREFESIIKTEVEKMKWQFEKDLESKKAEIHEQQTKTMESLSKELETLEEKNKSEELQRKHSEETSKLQAQLKAHKEAMQEEQRKQILQMQDYHKSFIEKLKKELNEEESKLRSSHEFRVADILSTFEKETSELKTKLKSEQDAVLNRLMSEFETERRLVEKELKEGLSSLRNEMNVLKSNAAVSQDQSNKTPEIGLKSNGSDEELKTLSAKYLQLEKKYGYLKKELKKLTNSNNNNAEVSPRKNRSVNETLIHNVTSKNDPSSGNHHMESEPEPEVTSENPSDSQSESTLYPSSSVNGPLDQKSKGKHDGNPTVEELVETNNNRLAAALKSVELLKSQIINIKQDQESLTTSRENASQSQKTSRSSKKSARHTSPVSTSHSSKQKNTNQTNTNGLKPSKKTLTTPGPPPSSRNGLKTSRSTSELPGLIEDSEESNEIVKEAKEFIHTQKERLNVPTSNNLKFDKPSSATWSSGNNTTKGYKYTLDEITYPKTRTSYQSSPKQSDLYSETESSGVGSMKDLKGSQEKKKISQDIEAICSSLSYLDEQMRLMWTVVQGNAQDKSTSSVNRNIQNNVISSLPDQIMPSKPLSSNGIRTKYPSTARPISSIDLQSLAPSVMSTSNRALIDSLKTANLPSSRMSASNLLNSLDKELKEFKAAKERILNQFTSQKNTPSESIQEKTKDLREWLEKF